ncbi:hypothetical protein E6P09_08840 [Haloferax mediterranei ATCC 33500]|uniref:DUF7308 domain-containing protein n=1 Tax=Haloferax mediterranei (strain ATCC 33500 / DSM 1411 / JCM 8866 / NBRC 14739 / NCIMB 2177 / R-4) TaxID=523841 RepID=I3R3R8_HALMT|nr:hypothetical protein [Haloferax mediterranei]AFK18878.1 hypothetical protein HFX_1164 [Haloferax mediterranei ATCC 33500]AHZ21758.1 hypothetical protein BM92_03385 [Haloferax mediterranei ATCC 33500]EMA03263.1 hypothetical protein C439_04675 [Haloferax mediterranei ATCC 33500]MDX5988972.1 hypothetical protein [Haloferax mediterranei ATCC 33500]QCQ75365.1 hypothetical protein E6P09_08840 [Haloferax mediterranei ATCC 33500]
MSGRPRVPLVYRVVRDRTAQTSPIAVILLLAITVVGTTTVVAFGGVALEETKQESRLTRAEHSMTLFDSRVAISALGEGDTQYVDLGGTGGGSYVIDDDSAWIRITHKNYTDDGDDEVLYNESLGSVEYRDGDTRIAYEGGGVWRTQDGGSTMVSPPEFHYRGATLTLPIVRLSGDGSASGGVRASVSATERARRVYPNETASYTTIPDSYDNPVSNGTVIVAVHSDHYKGWASFFESRTEGNVTVYDSNKTASVELETLGLVGEFQMPNEGTSLDVRGMAGDHNVSTFTITLSNDQHLQNMEWGMYYDGDQKDLELHVQADDKCKSGSYDGTFDLTLYYATEDDKYHGWQAKNLDPDTSDAVSIDCTTSNPEVTVDFTSSEQMTYGDIQSDKGFGNQNKWHFAPEIVDGSAYDSVTFDEHTADSGQTYHKGDGDTAEMAFVVNHYFSLVSPQFELTVTDGPGNSQSVDESGSSGELVYDQAEGGQFITFLHVTENEVEVRVE